jgi:hypothetical protein
LSELSDPVTVARTSRAPWRLIGDVAPTGDE